MKPIDSKLIGEVWSKARPTQNSSEYGSAQLFPSGDVEVRSITTFRLRYTAGPMGIDDGGGLKVVFRYPIDIGDLQTTDPKGLNYATAKSSNGAKLALTYDAYGFTRPRDRSLTINVSERFLSQGDTITITFGDTSGGSPGIQMQTFCESAFEFKVLVDICATGHFIPLSQTPYITIVPSRPCSWRAVAPTLTAPGKPFSLGVRVDDKWGNPSNQVDAKLRLFCEPFLENLPDQIVFPPGQSAIRIPNLIADREGIYRIKLLNGENEILTESNPIVVKKSLFTSYWGDLHGQTGETTAINSAEEYFRFARDLAFLDVTSHQGNDFQITPPFWKQLNRLTAKYNQDHQFIVFPGYEWSGNTPVGGDHNVFFKTENRPIRRSSHTLIDDRSEIESGATDLKRLFSALKEEDCVVYSHVGGRYAKPSYAHDPETETAMEIHSAWGTFEWLLTDGFELGHRCGVVCNSDDHRCRPGASHPGASEFGSFGGLTCFLSPELTRDAIFNCMRRRHHYGTTGNRLYLNVQAKFNTPGNLFIRDPRIKKTDPQKVTRAMMGDIVQTDGMITDITVEAITRSPIEKIDILNGKSVVKTIKGYAESELGKRIRIIWGGADSRGRNRKTNWKGQMNLGGAKIVNFQKINAWNHEQPFEQINETQVVWNTITTGNFMGFDMWLDNLDQGTIHLDTNQLDTVITLCETDSKNYHFNLGGLDKFIKVYRLPGTLNVREIKETLQVHLTPVGDNPIWTRVTTEDGFNAWSSPMFIYRKSNKDVP